MVKQRKNSLKAILPCPRRTAAWVAILTFALLTGAALTGRDRMVETQIIAIETPRNPTELTAQDRGLYAMIFAAQARQDWRAADTMIHQLNNRNLVGYLLAQRYLNGYPVSNEDLDKWLKYHSDDPHAPRIAQLALERGVAVVIPETIKPLRGDGYSDHLGRTTMPDSWFTALGKWREGDHDGAGAIFTKLSANENLSPWQRSAAYYWAYRAADELGNDSEARENLKNASQYATTFYGLLAAKQLGRVNIVADAPEVSDSMRNSPRAIRASLLAQLDRMEEAENELRALYAATAEGKRGGVVTLASELNMPNLQMRLGTMRGLSDREAIFAQYPAPQYMVDLHPVMDSALLLAVARNESGFRAAAYNPSGATGMMQMLPSTARVVEKRVTALLQEASNAGTSTSLAQRLNNPALSARYGAEYLKILMKEPAIESNLIYLLVGYNAGPGTAASWKNATRNVSDPLLYIESIPYPETRNYVMQVSAQYWIYQLTMDETPTTLNALSKGEWPTVKAADV